jgi:UPF0755 protein
VRRTLRTIALLALLLAALVGLWHHDTALPLRPEGAPPLALEVPPGTSAEGIAGRLLALGLVRHPVVFRLLVRQRGAEGRLRAGSYTLSGPQSLVDIVAVLERGEVQRHDVTIPEGRNLEEAAALVASQGVVAADFLAAARDPAPIRDLDPAATDLEGYLFPDTYDVPHGPEGGRALVTRMVQRFRARLAPHTNALARSGLTLREVVTLASLVELETGQAQERSRIAAVFLNRLRKGMPLQTDPTVIYALRRAGRWDGNIRRADLEIDSPYNTYRVPGLPPGPIASPGIEAIVAVLQPAEGRELYFVSRNDGTHQFSESLRDHEAAVDRYQRRRARAAAPALPATPPLR